MKTFIERVERRLFIRENYEPNPYYKGRYLVAVNTLGNAARCLPDPYTIAELLFQQSRYAKKVQTWLEQRREYWFHGWTVNADGTIGAKIYDFAELAATPLEAFPGQSVRALTHPLSSRDLYGCVNASKAASAVEANCPEQLVRIKGGVRRAPGQSQVAAESLPVRRRA